MQGEQTMTEQATKPVVNIADIELQTRPPAFAAKGEAAARYDARMGMIAPRIGARLLGYNITSVPPGMPRSRSTTTGSTKRCST